LPTNVSQIRIVLRRTAARVCCKTFTAVIAGIYKYGRFEHHQIKLPAPEEPAPAAAQPEATDKCVRDAEALRAAVVEGGALVVELDLAGVFELGTKQLAIRRPGDESQVELFDEGEHITTLRPHIMFTTLSSAGHKWTAMVDNCVLKCWEPLENAPVLSRIQLLRKHAASRRKQRGILDPDACSDHAGSLRQRAKRRRSRASVLILVLCFLSTNSCIRPRAVGTDSN
jgi:hypothetical protein